MDDKHFKELRAAFGITDAVLYECRVALHGEILSLDNASTDEINRGLIAAFIALLASSESADLKSLVQSLPTSYFHI